MAQASRTGRNNNPPSSSPPSDDKDQNLRRRIVIVGAGQTGRSLVRLLSAAWDIAILDIDQAKLDTLKKEVPDRPIRAFNKDGTSLINLREAGIEGAEFVTALTNVDEVNIETCRVALSVESPPTAIGILRQPKHIEKLKQVGAVALTRPAAISGLVFNQIERGQQVAVNVGLGRGEIIEIPVLPTSPAADVRVADLRAGRWLVAAIYRGDKLMVPHGDVVIRSGDRLLLTGDPDILPHIGDYLRAGVARFPLQYGIRMVALGEARLPERYRSELEFFATRTRTRALRLLVPQNAASPDMQLDRVRVEVATFSALEGPEGLIRRELSSLDCGCLVVPKTPPEWLSRLGLVKPPFARLMELLPCPILLAAGSHPYRRILLPVTDPEASLLSAELAIDLSRQLDLRITSILVSAPSFIGGQEVLEEQKTALKNVIDMASLYHMKVEQLHREGNPVAEITREAGDGDLLIACTRAGRRTSVFNPDPTMHVINRASCSVLALSFRKRPVSN
jgi:Trk K+ transport system NAD-binding subunit/nucleotide-binding universal stress UspA family protein